MTDDWREITADWQGGTGFVGKNSSGIALQMGKVSDQPGASPMEMLLISLAGCTGMDVASILEKGQQDLRGFQLAVRGKRRDEHPRIYTEIEIEYRLWGDLDPKAVERAINLSKEKYCSVSAMLASAAKIHARFTIHPVDDFETVNISINS
jgi:putative redox protein